MPSVEDREQTDRVIILANPNPSPCSVTRTYNLRRAMVMAPLAGDSHRGWTSRLQSRPSDQLRPAVSDFGLQPYTCYHSYTINVRTRHSSLQNMQKSTWSLFEFETQIDSDSAISKAVLCVLLMACFIPVRPLHISIKTKT